MVDGVADLSSRSLLCQVRTLGKLFTRTATCRYTGRMNRPMSKVRTVLPLFQADKNNSHWKTNTTRNVGQCPTWWSPCQTQVARSVQRRKVWLTPTTTCRAVTLPRRETSWNLVECLKLTKRSQPLVGRSSPYCGDIWRTYRCLTFFSDCRYVP